MCGITGYINKNSRVNIDILKKMTDAIAHRGPDDDGYFVSDNVALGHRRLSIIDLEGGRQPFYNDDESVVLVYNGECYNFKELRRDLESKGYLFKTNSDTEVVLRLYEAYGTDAFLKINGMFALAVYDRRRHKVLLARDRYGVKPLYYSALNGTFLFGSEIKAIHAHSAESFQVDYDALNEYFSFQNIFSQKTLSRGISKLDHGCFLELDLNSFDYRICRYWDYCFDSSSWEHGEDDTVMILREAFQKAVERQLVADVPVGSYLSGGIDSGGITAVAAQVIPRLCTFTCGFDLSEVSGLELDFDERYLAESVSAKYYTKHHEIVLNSKDLEWCIDDVIYHLDEPVLGMSYPNYYISELAGKYVKVVFSGAGGDELFGGYPWRYFRTTDNGRGKDNYNRSYYNYWQRLVPDYDKEKLFTPDVYNQMDKDWPYHAFESVFKGYDGPLETEEDYINKSLYFEAKTFLQGLFLIDDKLNMAHSVEARVPFMDNDLVDLAMRIPARYKIKNLKQVISFDENETAKTRKYYIQSSDGKNILRKALNDFLPKSVFDAKKQGFSAPDESWIRNSREEYIKKIQNPEHALYDVLNLGYVRDQIDAHICGEQNNRLFVWSIISAYSFFQMLQEEE